MLEKLVKKVMLSIQGGEEANVAKTVDTIESTWKKQIKNGENVLSSLIARYDTEIEEQEERVEDAKKAYMESFSSISSEKMNVDERKEYVVKTYQVQITKAKNALTVAEAVLTALKEQKEKEIKTTKEGIEQYKEFLKIVENID